MLNIDDEFGLDDLIEADIQYGLFEDDNKMVYQQESTNQNQKNTSNLYRNHNWETNPKVNKIIKVIFIFLVIYFLTCIIVTLFMAITQAKI